MLKPFLTANWRYLAMLNFAVDPKILQPLVPSETELDFHDGQTFLSVVGFLFLDTRVIGVPIPLHRDFEEVNLRFYVRRKARTNGGAELSSCGNWFRGRPSPSWPEHFTASLIPRCRCGIISSTKTVASLRNINGAGAGVGKRWP